jgi:hypothetical protein
VTASFAITRNHNQLQELTINDCLRLAPLSFYGCLLSIVTDLRVTPELRMTTELRMNPALRMDYLHCLEAEP